MDALAGARRQVAQGGAEQLRREQPAASGAREEFRSDDATSDRTRDAETVIA